MTSNKKIQYTGNSDSLIVSTIVLTVSFLTFLYARSQSPSFSINPFLLFLAHAFAFIWLNKIMSKVDVRLKKIENYLSLFIVAIFSVHLVIAFLGYLNYTDPASHLDCNHQSPLRVCYNVTEEACNMVWQQSEDPCMKKIQAAGLDRAAGSLIGPPLLQCRYSLFDDKLYYNRINKENPTCQTHFSRLR